MTIPRIIHQIWVGPVDPPMHWIDSWKLDGWEHRLWREADLDALDMENRRVYDQYQSIGTWHGMSDVARVEILCQQGGLFMDADMEMIAPLDGAPWLEEPMFAVREPDNNWLANGMMGCVPGAPAMLAYRDAIGKVRRRHPLKRRRMYPVWMRVGPRLLTSIANSHHVHAVDAGAFFPETKQGDAIPYGGTVYGRHHWFTTRTFGPHEPAEGDY